MTQALTLSCLLWLAHFSVASLLIGGVGLGDGYHVSFNQLVGRRLFYVLTWHPPIHVAGTHFTEHPGVWY